MALPDPMLVLLDLGAHHRLSTMAALRSKDNTRVILTPF
jgi:hypothetical protein